MGPAVRILIVDRQPIVREGLRSLLTRSGLDVVGDAGSGEEAIAAAKEEAPDVVVMDLSLPGMTGVEVATKIRAEHPACSVVVLTAQLDRQHVLDALDAGVAGYLLKDDDLADLVAAIRAAAQGGKPLSAKVASVVLDDRAAKHMEEELSVREREVLILVADGMSNRQIADRLGITEGTVKAHLGRAFRHIGVTRRTQAVLWVQQQRVRPSV
jgi:DNA-binding NarL/FixJ family response regulator